MNDIERIKDDIEKIVAFLASNTHILVQNSDLIKQIAERQVKPTQPEGYQGLNKWYRTSIGHIIYAVSINQFNCYGIRVKSEINKETHWCNDFSLQYDNINRLATESEIKEAILKGCEQKGIVDGARVKSLKTNEIKKLEFGKYILDYSKKLNIACYMGVTVFDNGKFAEVVKQDNVQCIHPYPSDTNTCLVCGEEMVKNFNCEDGNCIKQCDKCKNSFDTKPTDKELLKECALIIKSSMDNYVSYSSRILMENLQTKLNKHLNYE